MNLEMLNIFVASVLGFPAGWFVGHVSHRLAGRRPPLALPGLGIGFSLVLIWAVLAGPGGWLLAASGLLAWALSALALIDVMTFRLPNLLTYPLILSGLLVSMMLPQPDFPGHLIGALAGFGSLALVGGAYRRLRGREGLGLGDAKLMGAGGAWLGWQSLPTVLLAACACAMLWVLVQAVLKRRLALDQPIAFGPPLCAGIWLVWLHGPLGGVLS